MVFNVKYEMMFVLNEFNRAVLKRFYKCIKKKIMPIKTKTETKPSYYGQ